ncbi:hydantoinase/oxoprolinase family protein [Conexibacter sp. JD483]|uniref:hydantoinase/oxoprolinase family protein n=1 Tax=unclassified Conexibacter TaxID=2627773 RepID=UPI00272339D4|nr:MULTISPECIES: hydantoinase/oxoprolinase family protein [unclassified Conexibacter]MDO8186532.1 hydantoinase/oxoprolinase family protein [Conexibacter sp. CPCC 205706]MDO8200101.1 hydantoinase/oxoprolinase family protein [Conexibacter sp. CPCC 205762]MDR9372553.1 hydantoinase/oxoprolinase family protein [Conexibacter sp. JD483]
MTSYRLAVDVGGTFTDLVLSGERVGRRSYKTSSTPHDPAEGVVNGLRAIASDLGIAVESLLERTPAIVHGTTITTNALLTRSGARTGLLATRGFRDTLRLRQGLRARQFDSRTAPPQPLVPRWRVHGVGGRFDRRARELEPLDEQAVVAAARAFAHEGVEAVAIAFLFSFLDPAHELRAAELVRQELPGAYVSLSAAIAPEVRLYERTSTAVVNAYVGPILRDYLTNLRTRLKQLRFGGSLLVMQSNGGVATPEVVAEHAVSTLLSGPAGGPIASAAAVAPLELPKAMTIDMGGTSFEVSLARGGVTDVRPGGLLGDQAVTTPMLDISTIGAGGGSIAWVTAGGMLRVGPQSAGASPGPACYGRGGTQATVTDAGLLLGYVGGDSFGGGELSLARDAAERAVDAVAAELGIDRLSAAAGIYDTVNAAMTDSLRLATVSRGLDPREFALVAAGGAGPVHAAALAADLEIPLVVVPRDASVLCAAGMLVTDFVHHGVRTVYGRTPAPGAASLGEAWAELEEAARAQLEQEGVAPWQARYRRSLEVRYVGQVHQLELDLPEGEPVTAALLDQTLARFPALHRERYGHVLDGVELELVNVRVEARGPAGESEPAPPVRPGEPPAPRGERDAWFDGRFAPTPVFAGETLGAGARLEGPALVELRTSTIVVPPGTALTVAPSGSFLLHGAQAPLDGVLDRLHAGGVSV